MIIASLARKNVGSEVRQHHCDADHYPNSEKQIHKGGCSGTGPLFTGAHVILCIVPPVKVLACDSRS